ncbi:MAG: hypothetical protein ACYCYE_10945 [Clostridia bacterium]
MFKKKRSGNIATFISIVLILVAFYVFRLVSPQKGIVYSDIIQYNNIRYVYVETIKSSPFMFARKRPVSEDGYIILARRGISIKEEVYIYEGYMKYRRYEILKE